MSQMDDLEDGEGVIALPQGRGRKTCMHAVVHCTVMNRIICRLERLPALTAAMTRFSQRDLSLSSGAHGSYSIEYAPKQKSSML